jgi:hypothetical protein
MQTLSTTVLLTFSVFSLEKMVIKPPNKSSPPLIKLRSWAETIVGNKNNKNNTVLVGTVKRKAEIDFMIKQD